MWGIIATWRMAAEGLTEAVEMFKAGEKGDDAIVKAVTCVEDYPFYKSVGYGGLPNENGDVELDAAFMNGNDLSLGMVAGVRDIKNPVLVARLLSQNKVNNFLVGQGAEEFATRNGFHRKTMLTDRAILHYNKRKKELAQQQSLIKAYDGHDTVGIICLDPYQSMYAATSTSGLFMKKHGRVGDSPVPGSGFYVDSSIGGATATGLGEDLMKGCISYEIVRLMAEGLTPQQACNKAVAQLDATLRTRRGEAGDLSLVAMNNRGEWGVATNIETFSFSVATATQPLTIYLCNKQVNGLTTYRVADAEWLDAYEKRIKEPIV